MFLYQLADLIERDKEEMAALETIHNGKPFAESIFDMNCCINTFRYYAGAYKFISVFFIHSRFDDTYSNWIFSGYADKIHGLQIPAGCYSFIHI